MRVHKARIRGYKSLSDVEFELSDFTILVGENGVGKTNILEALYLFFKDLEYVDGSPSPFLNEAYCWFEKNTEIPIEITVTLEMMEEECGELFGKRLLRIAKETGRRYRELTICRRISKPGEKWSTRYIKWGDIPVVKNDQALAPEELAQLETDKIPAVYQFGAALPYRERKEGVSTLVSDRLIVFGGRAYQLDPFIDGLVQERQIPVKNLAGVDHRDWVVEKGIELMERPPTNEELLEFLPPRLIVPRVLGDACRRMVDMVKGQFKLVMAARDVRITPAVRKSLLDKTTILEPLSSLPLGFQVPDERKWDKIRRAIEKLINKRVDVTPEISVWDGGLRLPVACMSGGEQEVIGLVWHLYSEEGKVAIGIEEPEIHLFPKLSSNLLELLREESRATQIILTTHSPVFVDASEPRNNVMVWKQDMETRVRRVESEGELEHTLGQLRAQSTLKAIESSKHWRTFSMLLLLVLAFLLAYFYLFYWR